MFEVKELPYSQLEALGLSKEKVHDMPPVVLNALLAGKKTPVLTFSDVNLIKGVALPEITGRLSVERGPDGKAELRLHTPLTNLPTTVHGVELEKAQIDLLKSPSNPILPFSIIDNTGKERQYLVQYDKALNDLHVRPVTADPVPAHINGHKLTEQQKETFQKGMNIETPDGNIRKDMNDPFGYKANFLILSAVAVLTGPLTLAAIVTAYIAVSKFESSMRQDSNRAPEDRAPSYRTTTTDNRPTIMDYLTRIEAKLKDLFDPSVMATLTPQQKEQATTIKENVSALKEQTAQSLSTGNPGNKEQATIAQPAKGSDIQQGIAENMAVEGAITPAKHVPVQQVHRAQLRV